MLKFLSTTRNLAPYSFSGKGIEMASLITKVIKLKYERVSTMARLKYFQVDYAKILVNY